MRSNNADILFVFPPAHGNIGAFKTHLGVAYLRAALSKESISTAQYLNEYSGNITAIATDILKHRPRIVGFTVYDANFLLALSLTRAIKKLQPDVKVLFGGPTATFGAARILEHHSEVDVCVTGEAEETGARIFSTLLNDHSLTDTQPGVTFRQGSTIVSNSLPPLVGCDCPAQSALDTTPSPYLSGILTDGHAGILTGRGCTHHCQYCVFASLGRKKLRVHSIERVISELEYIAEQQKRTGEHSIVAIHDDAFTLLPKRAKELCQAIADKNLGLVLSCITRADALDDELLRLMREAGFISLAFGLESAVPSVLRATGKVRDPDWPDTDLEPERHFVEQVRTSVIGAKKHGFNVGVSIILGLPTETAEDGATTLRFVKDMPVDFYMHNFLWVFPGTPLWKTQDRFGIKSTLNDMGLPTTYEYAYDITKLRPRPKCSLEQEAHSIRLLTANALFACSAGSTNKNESIHDIVIHAPELSIETAAWLSKILSIGGMVIQVYPPMKQSEKALRLYNDRYTFNDQMVPARHHVQLLTKKTVNEGDERWSIACSGVDLYTRHKPALLSFISSESPAPLLDWLEGTATASTFYDISDYLKQPDELIQFLDESDEENIGRRLRKMRIPPDLKYPGRWIQEKAPCRMLTRIEIDEEGIVRCCRHGEPLGKAGDSRENLLQRYKDLTREIAERRGCDHCANKHCSRCPFPGVDDQTYCSIMTKQARVLRLLQAIRIYARLPLMLDHQREQMGSD